MKTNLRVPVLIMMIFLFLTNCKKKDEDIQIESNVKTDLNENEVMKFFKDRGFDESQIKKVGNDYVVEGDILFSEEEVLSSIKNGKTDAEVNQYGTGYYMARRGHIVMKIDSSLKDYLEEIRFAARQWMYDVPNARIIIYTHNPSLESFYGPSNLIITNANLGSNVCGDAYFPKNGQPGSRIRINIALMQQLGFTFDQRQRTITHELGHALGFRHTNWFSRYEPTSGTDPNGAPFTAVHINGTPTGHDPYSLMNGGECGTGATVLSEYDKIAALALYPDAN